MYINIIRIPVPADRDIVMSKIQYCLRMDKLPTRYIAERYKATSFQEDEDTATYE